MKYLAILLLVLPLGVSANAELLNIGATEISYESALEDGASTLYYDDQDVLVASAHDTDDDGVVDSWLQYQNDYVTLEARDTNGDGAPNVFTTLREDGEVIEQTGTTPSEWEVPENTPFESLIDTASEDGDLVGDLSSIEIPHGGGFLKWIILLLLLGGGYYWYRNHYSK